MCCVDWRGVNLVLKRRQIVCGHNANGLRPFLAKNVVETNICIRLRRGSM